MAEPMTLHEAIVWCADHSAVISFHRGTFAQFDPAGAYRITLPNGEYWSNVYHPASFASMFPYTVECFAAHLKTGSCLSVVNAYIRRARQAERDAA